MRKRRIAVTAALLVVVFSTWLVLRSADTRPWINQALHAPAVDPDVSKAVAARDPSLLVAVTLSGGGARAAAFGYGVLRELRDTAFQWDGKPTDLLDATDVISGVSGGSIVAAYFAAFGPDKLQDFEPDFLRRNFQNSLLLQSIKPANLYDLSSPWFGRSNLLERRLDALFQGRTYGDLARRPRHPELLITATDMAQGAGFEFTADQFEQICSEFESVPLSFAVAASSSVPMLLSPMTLRNHSQDCRRDGIPQRVVRSRGTDYRARMHDAQQRSYLDALARPYIHLVDGGVSDNLGVRRLLDRALAGNGFREGFREVGIPPGSVRRMVLITVNAERDPNVRIEATPEVPGTWGVLDALRFGSGSRATHETQEFLADLARQWAADLDAEARGFEVFARDARIHVIQVNLRDAPDVGGGRARLLQVPTALSVDAEEVDRLIDAGRQVLRGSTAFKALRSDLETMAPPSPPQPPSPATISVKPR